MAAKKSAQYPYQWHDGTWHSTPTAPPRVNPVAKPVTVKPVKPSVPKVAPPWQPLTMPVDADFEATVNNAQLTRQNRVAQLQQQRAGGLIDYGYSETNIDPGTGVGTLAFNPNDPFSKAALLKRTYDASRARTAQQMGSGGGLYSGAFQQAQDIGNRTQLQGEDALQNSLATFLAQNVGATKQTGIDFESAVGRADAARLDRLESDKNALYQPASDLPKPPPKAPVKPKGAIGKAVKVTHKPATLTAKPGGKKVVTTVKKKPKGKVVTYTRSVNRP